MRRVFISYRREDTVAEAGRLADFLREALGDQDVFIDVDTIKAGDDFVNAIEHAVGCCDVFVPVIGKRWTGITDAEGKLRLQDPNDFVRLEIASALRRNIRVIPVLIDGAPVPKASELPPDLSELPRRNCLEIRELHFRQDATALLDVIAGKSHITRRTLMRQPAVWLAAGLILGVLSFVIWKRVAPAPAPQSQFRLNADVHLSPQFGPVDHAPAMKLAHRLPVENGVNLLEAATPLGGQQYEYQSPVIMPSGGQQYMGLMHRLVDSAFESKPEWTTVCFERKATRNSREPVVRVACEEGAACTISTDDFGWAKACTVRSGGVEDPLGMREVYAASEQAKTAQRGWIAPSLETLRKRNAAFTVFYLKSKPLAAMQSADHVNYNIHVNGSPIYIDGLPPETNTVKFDSKAGLDLQFGLENLDFSGVQAGFEDIQVWLTFLSKGQPLKQVNVALKYVALRDMAEGPAAVPGGLPIVWRAEYRAGKADDVYQIFASATRSLTTAQDLKSSIDAAKLQALELPLLAILRPPNQKNPKYGIALGLRNPSGQIKFSFDESTSRNVCHEAVKIAAHSPVIDKRVYRRQIDNGKSEQCSSL